MLAVLILLKKQSKNFINLNNLKLEKSKIYFLIFTLKMTVKLTFWLHHSKTNHCYIKISENKIDISNSFQWIGDVEGFNLFQKEFFPNLKSHDPKHISTVHSNAFDKVIESNQVEGVGGFHITAHRTEFGIEYLFKMSLSMGRSETMTLKQSTNIIPWGNAGTGTFSSCHLKSDNPYKPAIGIHFPIGNFGALYYPRVSRKVIFYKDVDGFEFAEKVKSDYGIKIIGMIKNGEYMTRI